MSDPRVVNKYNDYLHDQCTNDNLYLHWDNLHKKTSNGWTADMEVEYERLDARLEKHTEQAEKQCRKLKMGTIPWSPTYQKIQLEYEYWSMRIKHKLGTHKNVR